MIVKLLTEHHFDFLSFLQRLARVYTCQNATMLEISCHGSNGISSSSPGCRRLSVCVAYKCVDQLCKQRHTRIAGMGSWDGLDVRLGYDPFIGDMWPIPIRYLLQDVSVK